MSLGSWDPAHPQSTQAFTIDDALLKRFISFAHQGQLDNLAERLTAAEIQQQAALMSQAHDDWLKVVSTYPQQDIEALMKFFTKAEQLPGWDAGDRSPVISLGKVLKTRKIGISKELTLWIKSHSRNRFLPHGSLI